MSKELADTIDNAADYIEKNGWRRHSMYGKDGTVCALGGFQASNHIERGESWYKWPERVRAAIHALATYLPNPQGYRSNQSDSIIAQWNDSLAKDKQEILDKMREASKDLRK